MEILGALLWPGIIIFFVIWGWISNLKDEAKHAKVRADSLYTENQELTEKNDQWENYRSRLINLEADLERREKLFQQLFKERVLNFPLVGQVWADLIEITESERERALMYKKRPALAAAREVSRMKKEKRELAKEIIEWKYKAQNYEAIYPWLIEDLSNDIQNEVEAEIYYSVYTEKEREDPVSTFISPEDYRNLSATERNQLALDRYWKQGKKTKWMIGKMYERYVGYLYEKEDWDVEYFGIHKRYEDLGRDLIAVKGKEMHVIQCKNWSQYKTIYENHIFQLFGTAFSMKKDHPKKNITPVFYTSTSLSETAREFANLLRIQLFENKKFSEYPCIKCNISSNGEKIYHLPFDQQYDTVRITPRTGEKYVATVLEAEKLGFRRAYRWRGVN